MSDNIAKFPILQSVDTCITPVSGFAWLVLIQRESEGDAVLTSFMGEKMKNLPPPPKPPMPDFAQYPEFSSRGIGMFAIPDAAWLALCKMGSGPNIEGPNPTELALMQFHQRYGRKVPRQNS